MSEVKEISEDSSFKMSFKTLATIAAIIASAVGYHYWIVSELEIAKNEPKIGKGIYVIDPADPAAKETYPPTRQEYNMKDELTRSEIMNYMQRTDDRIKRIEEK